MLCAVGLQELKGGIGEAEMTIGSSADDVSWQEDDEIEVSEAFTT
jgi:hypothetical protein